MLYTIIGILFSIYICLMAFGAFYLNHEQKRNQNIDLKKSPDAKLTQNRTEQNRTEQNRTEPII